ncbi:haloacid dehalogenase superfamily, subfamily IA, variant 3 with third motif having DD or ED [Micrococcales bacterium KH10]|nr:haloacid dehalogenase superfamily, subfamily IA, variant 3 with third motif having DD or ED [Micrococcales bacterium KH10]
MQSTPSLPAVLFDMDGTLVDTEPYWMSAETALVARFGGVWTHADALSVVGSDLRACARILQGRGVELSEDEIVAELIDTVRLGMLRELPWRPGAMELLQELRRNDVPVALVTMSYGVLAEVLTAACDPGTFAAVVTGDDVTHGKPHPEPYLTGAQRLGVDISQCVAIEDSPTGIRSAVASGARTIGVPNIVDLDVPEVVTVIPSLEELSVPALAAFVATGQLVTSDERS